MLQKKVSRVYRPAGKILGRDGSSFLNQSFSRCSRRDILNYLSFNLVWYSPRRPAQHWSTSFWKHKKDRGHRFNHNSPCSLSSLTPPWRNGTRHRRHVGTSSGNPYKPCNFLKALQTQNSSVSFKWPMQINNVRHKKNAMDKRRQEYNFRSWKATTEMGVLHRPSSRIWATVRDTMLIKYCPRSLSSLFVICLKFPTFEGIS